jgi:hypothetical protein
MPDTVEVELCDSGRGACLVMTIRHLGRGHIVYQPVIFRGGLPRDERSAAALFALAATSSEPIPVVAQMDVLRLRRGLGLQTLSRGPSMAAKNRSQHVLGEMVQSRAAARRSCGNGGKGSPQSHD